MNPAQLQTKIDSGLVSLKQKLNSEKDIHAFSKRAYSNFPTTVTRRDKVVMITSVESQNNTPIV